MNVVGTSDQFGPLFPDDFLPDIIGRIDLCLLHGNDEDVYFAFECKASGR